MWQLRQNDVCFARSMWFSRPSNPAKTGKIKNARNANIFPPRAMVKPGRRAIKAARAIAITRTANMRNVGILPPSLQTTPLLQAADVLDQGLDLIIGQFAIKFRHLAFAFFGDLDQIRIAFLGYFRRMKITGAHLLAGSRAFAVCSMADLAFRFV